MGDVGELPTLTSPYEFRQSTFLSIVLTGYALIWAVTTILIFFPIPLVRVLKPVINRFQSNDPSICHYHCSSGEEDHVEKTTQPRKMGKKWNVNWPDLDDKTAKPNDLDDWEKTAKKSPFWCKAEAIFEKIKLVFTGEPKVRKWWIDFKN